MQVYRNAPTPDNSLGLTYDASWVNAQANDVVNKGEQLLFVFTGGNVNDVAYVTLTGTME
jgi:hypothetical protein